MQVPELTDDAVVELAREGGVAFIPKLSGQRTIALSSLNEAQRQRLVSILEQAFPRGQPPGKVDAGQRCETADFQVCQDGLRPRSGPHRRTCARNARPSCRY